MGIEQSVVIFHAPRLLQLVNIPPTASAVMAHNGKPDIMDALYFLLP